MTSKILYLMTSKTLVLIILSVVVFLSLSTLSVASEHGDDVYVIDSYFHLHTYGNDGQETDSKSFDVDVTGYGILTYEYKTDTDDDDYWGYGLYIPGIPHYQVEEDGNYHTVTKNISGQSGVKTYTFELRTSHNEFEYGDGDAYFRDFELHDYTPPSSTGTLYLNGNSAGQTISYPNDSIGYQDSVLVDWLIDNPNSSRRYFINVTKGDFEKKIKSWEYDSQSDVVNNSSVSGRYKIDAREDIFTLTKNDSNITYNLYEVKQVNNPSPDWSYFFVEPLYYITSWLFDDTEVEYRKLDSVVLHLNNTDIEQDTFNNTDDFINNNDTEYKENPTPEPVYNNTTVPEMPEPGTGDSNISVNESLNGTTINTTWLNGYYKSVDDTLNSFNSTAHGFSDFVTYPIDKFKTGVKEVNKSASASFDTALSYRNIVAVPLDVFFKHLPDKVMQVFTFFFVCMSLLLVFKGRGSA